MVDRTVSEVAEHLGVSSRRVRQMIESGEMPARQVSRLWLVDSTSVARLQTRERLDGRRLGSDAAWAALYWLSGRDAGWLSRSTAARLDQRLRTVDGLTLAQLVATRTRVTWWRAANVARAQADLTPTGRPAAAHIGTDLLQDERRVAGYVPVGTTVEDYAHAHFMVSDPVGHDALYENTAPGGVSEPVAAVIAADLALSTDARERSAGTAALERLLDDYRNRRSR